MKRIVGICFALAFSIGPAVAEDADPEFNAYVASLTSDSEKAKAEFAAGARLNYLLTAYSLGMFAAKTCQFPGPSAALYDAAGGQGALDTPTGKRIFVAAGAVASMTYPTEIEQTNACQNMRNLLMDAEKRASVGEK